MKLHRRKQHFAEAMIAVAFIGFLLAVSFLRVVGDAQPSPVFGATFSSRYAKELGLDWRRAYSAVISELNVKHLRLPVYWDEVGWQPNAYNWTDIDWMLEEAALQGVEVTLAIGRKVPRWPECYIPSWTQELSREEQAQELLAYLRELVLRYDSSVAVVRWQVENEALFPFGECPLPDPQLFDAELALTHELSAKPVMLTVSGENDLWIDSAVPADVLGVSLYRTTWNNLTGYFIYPVGPEFYRLKSAAVRPLVDSVVLSELQAEPWWQTVQTETSLEDQAAMFTVEQLQEQVELAKEVGFDEVYLWGVEWWYWMKLQGVDELWQAGKVLFTSRITDLY